MQLAKVIGSVVSTQKSPSLNVKKMLLIQPLDTKGMPEVGVSIAVDSVGAGDGDTVLVTRGGAARLVFDHPNAAIDLAIVAIVDSVSLADDTRV